MIGWVKCLSNNNPAHPRSQEVPGYCLLLLCNYFAVQSNATLDFFWQVRPATSIPTIIVSKFLYLMHSHFIIQPNTLRVHRIAAHVTHPKPHFFWAQRVANDRLVDHRIAVGSLATIIIDCQNFRGTITIAVLLRLWTGAIIRVHDRFRLV